MRTRHSPQVRRRPNRPLPNIQAAKTVPHIGMRPSFVHTRCSCWLLTASQRRTLPSFPLERIVFASEPKATLVTGPRCPLKMPANLPPVTRQRRTMLSPPPERRYLPEASNTTSETVARWPLVFQATLPFSTSQMRVVPSALPEARYVPSGLNARAVTSFLWPIQSFLVSSSSQ